ncbi:MAG: hypothetical protein R3B93_21940 [Bacteroidia bacterium]
MEDRESQVWPKLTEVGGSTEVGGEKADFMLRSNTQIWLIMLLKDFIAVVPEIDIFMVIPMAALVSYPELNCNPKMPT